MRRAEPAATSNQGASEICPPSSSTDGLPPPSDHVDGAGEEHYSDSDSELDELAFEAPEQGQMDLDNDEEEEPNSPSPSSAIFHTRTLDIPLEIPLHRRRGMGSRSNSSGDDESDHSNSRVASAEAILGMLRGLDRRIGRAT